MFCKEQLNSFVLHAPPRRRIWYMLSCILVWALSIWLNWASLDLFRNSFNRVDHMLVSYVRCSSIWRYTMSEISCNIRFSSSLVCDSLIVLLIMSFEFYLGCGSFDPSGQQAVTWSWERTMSITYGVTTWVEVRLVKMGERVSEPSSSISTWSASPVKLNQIYG